MVAMFRQIGRDVLGNNTVGDAEHQDFVPIVDAYNLYETYYFNRMYQRTGTYRDKRSGLPVNIRPLHNPAALLVDWYASRVAPGSMTDDGLPVNGQPNRIPFDDQVDEAIRLAVQQAFLWGSAGFDLGLYVRTGAMLGDVFAEIVSDPERQKVYPKLIHPRYVTDVEWNDTGDVTRYQIEIPQIDGKGNSYTWEKIVDKAFITTLKDGKAFAYDGEAATQPNPWGFVPAIWVQHRNIGGQHGSPCFANAITKIDELNGIVSEIDDYILKFTKQSIIIGTQSVDAFNNALTNARTRKRMKISGPITADQMTAKRDNIDVMAAEPPLSSVRLIENIGLADAVPHRDRLLDEIEKDFPEITFSRKLLDMSNPSGVAVEALTRDPQHRLDEAASNYDAGLIKLGQMCISIAAQCIRDGVWDRRGMTDQQLKFAGFSVDSYDRGELAFSIVPRTLVPETMDQKIAQAAALERLTTIGGLKRAGLAEDEAKVQREQNREAATFEADLSGRAFSAGSLFR